MGLLYHAKNKIRISTHIWSFYAWKLVSEKFFSQISGRNFFDNLVAGLNGLFLPTNLLNNSLAD